MKNKYLKAGLAADPASEVWVRPESELTGTPSKIADDVGGGSDSF